MRSLLRGHQANPIRRAASLAGTTFVIAALLAWTPGIAAGWNQSSAEATLWQLMNGDRVNNGRRPVLSNGTLVSLARWRSRDMIVRDYFSHIILGTNYQVFHWYDLNHLNYAWGGENIGWNSGYADGDSAVAINTAFMNSAEHRDNILNPVWTHGGIGAYGADNITWQGRQRSPRMYTELFMQARSAPAPTPKPPAPKPTPRPVAPAPRAVGTPRPSATAHPKPKGSATPKPTPDLTPLAAQAVMRAGDAWTIGAGYLLARDPFERDPLVAQNVVTGYRINAPAPADRGFFETVLGTLLSFVL